MSSSFPLVYRFDGTNVHDWIFMISHFFIHQRTPEEQRLTIASSYLDGAALAWYQWMYRNHQITSWAEFLCKLEIRFPSVHGSDYSHFTARFLGSDLEFASHCVMDSALDPFNPSDSDSTDDVSEECDSSAQFAASSSDFTSDLLAEMITESESMDPVSDSAAIANVQIEQTSSLCGIPFLESVSAVVDEDDIVGLSLLDDALHFTVDASLTNTYPYDPGPILSPPLNNFLPMILQFFAPFEPPPPKPHGRSFPMRTVEIQVTSELTMPPPPLEPPDVKYGGVTTEFVSLSMLFAVHHMLDRRPLSRTCSFSLSTRCLQFKLWDPGLHFNFVVLWEFTIKICCDDLSTLNAISRVTPLQSKDNVTDCPT